jgi:hypothetical protein
MNTNFNTRPRILRGDSPSICAYPLLTQLTPAQRLTQAFVLEKQGKPEPAIAEPIWALRPWFSHRFSSRDSSITNAANFKILAFEPYGSRPVIASFAIPWTNDQANKAKSNGSPEGNCFFS